MSQSGKDVPIDNLKSRGKEVNWMMEPVGFQEMFTIVNRFKRRKAPCPDGIINKMLNYGGNKMVEESCSLVNLLIESRYWPDDWRQSYIVPLFKAGDEKEAGKYREGYSSGELCGKSDARLLESVFSENYILEGVRVDSGQGEDVLIRS